MGSEKQCDGEYGKCPGLDCGAKKFPCVNEIRRKETAAKIKEGSYRPDNWIPAKVPKWAQPLRPKEYRSDPPKLKKPESIISTVKRRKWEKGAAVDPRLTRTAYQDAYCGDGLLKYILGRVFLYCGASTPGAHLESNAVLTTVLLANENIFPGCERLNEHQCGTIYEAHVCRIFETKGLYAAARFVVETFERANPGRIGAAWMGLELLEQREAELLKKKDDNSIE